MRKTFIAFVAIPVLLAASVARANAQVYTSGQRVDTTMTLEENGTLRVSVYAGRVNVTGTSGNKVHIKGTVVSGEMEVRSRYSTVTVDMDENPSRSRAELDISVPTGTSVIVEGFSAAFTVRGVKGEAQLEALSGDIQVADAVGPVSVETVSGDINVTNVKGNVQAEAVSGIVIVAGVDGDVEAESVSGRLSITGAKSKSVRAETVSGSITYSGTIDPLGNYVLKTHAGQINLGIPNGASATVSLETFSGSVDSDFPVTLTQKTIRQSHESKFEFVIGDGRSRIVLETFSGDIRIQRGTTSSNQE